MATGAEVITRGDVLITLEKIDKEKKSKPVLTKLQEKKAKAEQKIENLVQETKHNPKQRKENIPEQNQQREQNSKAIAEESIKKEICETKANPKKNEQKGQNSKTVKKRKAVNNNRKKRKHSSSSDTDTEIKYDEDSDDYDFWEKILHGSSDNDKTEDIELDDDKENCVNAVGKNDWVLVKFCTKKSLKHYVGVVININDDGSPVIQYTRRKSKSETSTIFAFPVVDDISELKHTEDIITKLPTPAIGQRGQVTFKMSFNSFNIQ